MKKLVVGFWLLAVGAAGAAMAADYTGGTVISSGTVSGKHFSGTYENSVYIVKGGGNDVTFENCTFDGVSADANGSCVSIDRDDSGSSTIWFKNCRFINCGNTGENGGAIYIKDMQEGQKVVFENCVAIGCKAEKGGFLYCNDIDAVIKGNGNTVISGCSAVNGGGVYIEAAKTFDGFILADNTSTKDGGGLYNNTGSDGVSTVSNCRFYHNVAGSSTSKYAGGGLYARDDNGYVKNCKFFENVAYKTGAELDSNTEINNCTFTSNFGTGDEAVDGSDQVSCTFLSASNYSLTKGGGTEANPFRIENVDDWDALYFSVKCGNTYEKAFIVLSSDILVANTIGGFNSNPDLKRPFKGTFDGNGHTITLYSLNGGSDKATFGCAQGATVRNLTVDGRIEGAYSLGGIFGNGSGSTASNCVNNATIVGTAHYIGGIAGWSGNGSRFINCVNNGKVEGDICVGGIAGLSGGNSRFLNCLNSSDVAGTDSVGGIVGSEESAVSVENCHEFGSFNFPVNGDFVIYTALDSTMCLDFEGSGTFTTDDPQIWTADGSEKQTFTLKYDQSKGGYIIKSKHSGLVLMRDSSTGGLYQYDDYNLGSQRWEFIPTGDGYYYIHSLDCSSTEGYLDVTGAKADKGTNVGTYTFNGNANQKFRLVRTGEHMGGITGHSASGSTHEMCVFSKDDSPDNGCGIGVSHDALWGSATDTVDGKEFKMPDSVNDYIAANGKQKDGWLRVAFDADNQPVVVPNGPTDELGYSVGQISGTEYIFWKLGKLYRVTDGVAVVLPYTLVGGGTSSFDDGKWYVVEGVVERGKITVNGTANLVLLQGASLTASGGNKEAGIAVTGDNVLSVFGVRGGLLTANGGGSGAGIGGGAEVTCGTVMINGGTVTATGGSGAAGIGGGDRGAGGNVTILGGEVTATGSDGGAGIGGGDEAPSQGSLTLGVRIANVGDNHWKERENDCIVDYVQPNGAIASTKAYLLFSLNGSAVMPSGWYVVTGEVSTADITVDGTANLILADGASLVVTGGAQKAGIGVGGNETLNIYGQRNGTGSLKATGGVDGAGIGGDAVNNGGGAGGTVTINGGRVTATGGGGAAGIGGGAANTDGGAGGTVTINGGRVTAQGGTRAQNIGGAGIGGGGASGLHGRGDIGGGAGGTVTINGGTVNATGGYGAAGIGGGNLGHGRMVTVTGGTVNATGGTMGAGIGGGCRGDGGTVSISGGTVLASDCSSDYIYGGAGIGGGYFGFGGTVTISGGAVKAVVSGANRPTIGRGAGSTNNDGSISISGGIFGMTVEDKWCADGYWAFTNPDSVTSSEYPYAVLPAVTVTLGNLKGVSAAWTDRDETGMNPVNGTFFHVKKGARGVRVVFTVDSAYTLDSGELEVELGDLNADVRSVPVPKAVHRKVQYVDGNGRIKDNDNFSIFTEDLEELSSGWYLVEGTVERQGGIEVLSDSTVNLILADGASLTVKDVDAWGAGIEVGPTASLNVFGQQQGSGVLSVTGGDYAAGIGGGYGGAGGAVTINGGRVTVAGRAGGAGIGGGYLGDGGRVTITGGAIDAKAGSAASRIGAGLSGEDQGRVSVSGGVFSWEVDASWCAEGYGVFDNKNAETCGSYPYAVRLVADSVPTCEGGDIAEVGGVWVITPEGNVAAVTIENLPTGAAVAIKLNGYTIPSAAFMGFGTGENANVFSLALDPEGEVNGVKVQPTIGELSEDEGEPFVVGEGSAAVKVKSIPGLKYTLKRTDSLRRAEDVAPYQEVAVETATEATVTLTDDDPPADKAFYTIGVSVP